MAVRVAEVVRTEPVGLHSSALESIQVIEVAPQSHPRSVSPARPTLCMTGEDAPSLHGSEGSNWLPICTRAAESRQCDESVNSFDEAEIGSNRV